jgi:hypothetical protein
MTKAGKQGDRLSTQIHQQQPHQAFKHRPSGFSENPNPRFSNKLDNAQNPII